MKLLRLANTVNSTSAPYNQFSLGLKKTIDQTFCSLFQHDIPIDKDGRIAIDWGVYGIPETFLINSKGIIKYRHVGQITKKTYKKINLLINEIE